MGKAGRILVDERNAFFHDNCRFYLGKPCGHQESVNDSFRVATVCSHLPPYSSPLPFSSTLSYSSRPSSFFVHCFALLCILLPVVVFFFSSFPPGRSSSSVPFSHSPSPSLTLAVRCDDVRIQTLFQSNV